MTRAGYARAAAGLAALLGLGAALTAASARRTERRNPPAGKCMDVGDTRVHYTDEGCGTAIVLLHGNGVTLEDWRTSGVVDALRASHRVVAIDRPGFGYSARPRGTVWTPDAQAEIVHEVIRRLNLGPSIVVGHSWATLVAVALALGHPSDVLRLVLISGYYFPTLRPDVPPSAVPAIPVLGDVMRYTLSPALGRLAVPLLRAQLFAPARVPDRFDRFPLAMSLRPSQLRANAQDSALMVSSAAAFAPRYRSLRIPTTIVSGTADAIVDPDQQSRRLAQTLPNARLVEVDGGGHMVHYTETGRVVDAILGT